MDLDAEHARQRLHRDETGRRFDEVGQRLDALDAAAAEIYARIKALENMIELVLDEVGKKPAPMDDSSLNEGPAARIHGPVYDQLVEQLKQEFEKWNEGKSAEGEPAGA
jgi:hypothetical protein